MELSTLSWLVLLASACNGVKVVTGIIAAIFIVAGIIAIASGFGAFDYTKPDENTQKKQKQLKIGGIFGIIFGVIFAISASFVPSEKAVFMAAGLETINKFSQTDAAKELGESGMNIVKDISTIIHDYTLNDKRN